MATPSVGRAVHVRTAGQCNAATIAYVWSDTMVNLNVIDTNGNAFGRTSVAMSDEQGDWHWPEFVPQTSPEQDIVDTAIAELASPS